MRVVYAPGERRDSGALRREGHVDLRVIPRADCEVVAVGLRSADRDVQCTENSRLACIVAAHQKRQTGPQLNVEFLDALEIPNRDALQKHRRLR